MADRWEALVIRLVKLFMNTLSIGYIQNSKSIFNASRVRLIDVFVKSNDWPNHQTNYYYRTFSNFEVSTQPMIIVIINVINIVYARIVHLIHWVVNKISNIKEIHVNVVVYISYNGHNWITLKMVSIDDFRNLFVCFYILHFALAHFPFGFHSLKTGSRRLCKALPFVNFILNNFSFLLCFVHFV